MVRLVFAYGSLMRGGLYEEFLPGRRDVKLLGPARCRGTLYDLGDGPGLIGEGRTWVAGELFRCERIEELLTNLDQLEGDLFVRRLRPVRWRRGTAEAWLYLYAGPLDEAVLVPGGSWKARMKRSRLDPEQDPG